MSLSTVLIQLIIFDGSKNYSDKTQKTTLDVTDTVFLLPFKFKSILKIKSYFVKVFVQSIVKTTQKIALVRQTNIERKSLKNIESHSKYFMFHFV